MQSLRQRECLINSPSLSETNLNSIEIDFKKRFGLKTLKMSQEAIVIKALKGFAMKIFFLNVGCSFNVNGKLKQAINAFWS
jgi:hypothetical protein